MKVCEFLFFLFVTCLFTTIESVSNELHQRRGLNGNELTVLAYQYPPLFNYKKMKNGSYTFEGLFPELLEDIKDYLNISLKYVILNPSEVTEYGFWEALYKTLDSKKVDIVPFSMVQDFDTLKHMELAVAFTFETVKILQPWPDEQSRLKMTIRPFQPTVWLTFFITTTIFVLTTAAFIKNRYKIDDVSDHESTMETISNQVEYVIRITTNQGSNGSHTRDRSSYKILAGLWLLSMIVLINGYSGVLTSFLTIPKLNSIANTLQDVAESNELRVTIEKNVLLSKFLLEATEGYEKVIGDQLRQNPRLLVSDSFAAFENVIHNKTAYFGSGSLVNLMIREDVKTNGFCRVTSSPEVKNYGTFAFQMGFSKGSPYVPDFDWLVLRSLANGILDYKKSNHFHATGQCRTDVPPETKIGHLTLLHLSPAFFILGLGISVSILCFLVEIVIEKLLRK